MSCRPFCPTATVFDPPVRVVRNIYHPQIVQVIHPIEVINRHHCVPIPHHIFTVNTINEGPVGDGCGLNSTIKGTIRKARTSRSKIRR